ncbi:hypothetical protein [Bacillus sp. V59.32b]|uniref:hypothetical protein n=1 Tax=Bacillus sp. V59.32b TaxID=1758642 RepID=UPI000E3C636B|nr:hypothetical protein [Bacillus sp. V59.32b]RFU61173.1 hypothetical protein D0463_15460 [Bacillus sp. V59.32b]
MKLLISLCALLMIVSACGQKIPEPENKSKKIGFIEHPAAQVASFKINSLEEFEVKHFIKGNSMYVECFLKNFAFSQSSKKRRAFTRMFLDGRKINDYRTAAFVVKAIPEGKHEVKLEIYDENGKPTGLVKKFIVEIHSTI